MNGAGLAKRVEELELRMRALETSSCSTPPQWVTTEEIRHWLKASGYSDEITSELSELIASKYQSLFERGYYEGRRSASC